MPVIAFLHLRQTAIYLMIAGVLLFGLGICNATSLPPLIAQAEFDKKDASRVVTLTVAISQAVYASHLRSSGLFAVSRTPHYSWRRWRFSLCRCRFYVWAAPHQDIDR